MNVELLSQHAKTFLLRHAKVLLALLFATLSLLLYFTSLLSQLTLADTFVDITIYIIYIFLVLILASIAFIGYFLFEEEPLFAVDTYPSEAEALNLDTLLTQKEVPPFAEAQENEKQEDIRAFLTAAKKKLTQGVESERKGYDLVATMPRERSAAYLKEQHPQIAAVILLMIDPKQAESILKELDDTQRDTLLHCIAKSNKVTNKALATLEKALQKELSALQKECSLLRHLEADQIRALLRTVNKKELMFALKGARQELQEMFFANMSSKAAVEFKSVLASVSQVEQTKSHNAIKKLYLLAQQLRENGKIRATNKRVG